VVPANVTASAEAELISKLAPPLIVTGAASGSEISALVPLLLGVTIQMEFAAEAREVSLAHTASHPQTVQGGSGGTCQQDGAHRLGVAGQGRQLSGACACGSGLITGWATGG